MAQANAASHRNYYPAIDVAKFVLAFCVIAIHSRITTSMQGLGQSFTEALLYPTVAIFFTISGFLCFDRAQNKPEHQRNAALRSALLRSGKTILVMYLWWTVIYLPLTLLLAYTSHSLTVGFILDYIRMFLFSGMGPSSPQLWYLLALGLGFLILYRCLAFPRGLYAAFAVSALLFISGPFVPATVSHDHVLGMLYRATFNDTRNVVFTGGFYICCGAMIAMHKTAVRAVPAPLLLAILAVGIAIPTATVPIVGQLARPLVVIPLCALLIRSNGQTTAPATHRVLHFLRNASTIIFLIHVFFVKLFRQFVEAQYPPLEANLIIFLLSSVASLVAAAALYPLIRRHAALAMLFHA